MLIWIILTQINPFNPIRKTPYQSMIQPIFVQYKIYRHLRYILWYKFHQYLLMGVQMTLRHHLMTHQQKSWQIKEFLNQAKIHPIRYSTYQVIRMQNQVYHDLLSESHLTRQTTSIIKEDDVWKRTKIYARVKHLSMNQSKFSGKIQPSYLWTRTNQSSFSSNWTRIHYITGFISYPSWIHLKLYYQHFQKHTCYLWTIHP